MKSAKYNVNTFLKPIDETFNCSTHYLSGIINRFPNIVHQILKFFHFMTQWNVPYKRFVKAISINN